MFIQKSQMAPFMTQNVNGYNSGAFPTVSHTFVCHILSLCNTIRHVCTNVGFFFGPNYLQTLALCEVEELLEIIMFKKNPSQYNKFITIHSDCHVIILHFVDENGFCLISRAAPF